MVKAYGLTLVEVLVSLFLISIFLLMLDALYGLALRESNSNGYYDTAKHQLENVVSDAKARPTWDTSTLQAAWNDANQQLLPHGHGIVSGHYPALYVALYWGSASQLTCQQDHIGLSGCLHLALDSSREPVSFS
jgi:Tfp pilus assembly protein PilV